MRTATAVLVISAVPSSGRLLLTAGRRAAALLPLLGSAAGCRQEPEPPAAPEVAATAPAATSSGADMTAEVVALQAAFARDPASLPRRRGPDGGAAFARLTAPIHADQWAVGPAPRMERLRGLGALATAYSSIIALYGQGVEQTGGSYTGEIPDLLGAGLHTLAVTLPMLDEEEREAATDPTRSAQLAEVARNVRANTVAQVRTAMRLLEPPAILSTGEGLRLVDRFIAEAPALATNLGAESLQEAAGAVEQAQARVEDPRLAERLGQLAERLRADR